MISLENVSFAYEKNPVIKGLSYTEQDRVVSLPDYGDGTVQARRH